ncbi:MAG TPA: LysM peptidoglycan-binding domain-containing protein, partial [Aggregatilineales bacterium]|nr:LysM peptidoglycan-binding domain-containing protein [Aggregatilineales bacterium]
CVYTVKGGDYLFAIAAKFETGSNWRAIICDEGDDNLACDVNKPENIQPGWRIVVPSVKPSVCSSYGGVPK